MKRAFLTVLSAMFIAVNFAQEADSTQLWIDEIEQSLTYETGTIELESGSAILTVPKGFRYLDKNQSIYVLTDLWENPADSSILGMLVPENRGVLETDSWVFTLSYEDIGYVEDEDAEEIDYGELLKELQNDIIEANPERINQGFEPIEFIGWASSPYYDKNRKILHWAKELKFGQDSLNTLNYNLRILGRKGIFVLNAVASMSEFSEVKSNIDNVIGSIEFNEGYKYSDFIPDVDKVAAWTIGGLVAGKILTKVGFFVLIAKFWKLIALAIIGSVGGLWKYLRKQKNDDENQSLHADKNQE